MEIVDIRFYPIELPMVKPFRIAYDVTTRSHTIYVEVVTDEGISGWGEAVPTPKITGESFGQALANLEFLKRHLVGRDPLRVRELEAEMDRVLRGNSSVKAGISMALYDILGKVLKAPVYRLLGGFRTRFETDMTIGIDEPEAMARDAQRFVDQGFRVLKVKVGEDPDRDYERLKRIRDAVGYGVRVRIDANQAWSPKQAIRMLRRFERFELELVEQPVPAWDWEGLAVVRRSVDIPVVADEAVHSPREAFELISVGAVDGVNIKLMKCGGIGPAVTIARVAEAGGAEGCMIGCMVETRLALAAAAHVVAAHLIIRWIDLDGNASLADEPSTGGYRLEKGEIVLEDKPGLGVEVDREKLEKYRYELS